MSTPDTASSAQKLIQPGDGCNQNLFGTLEKSSREKERNVDPAGCVPSVVTVVYC